MQDTGRLSGNDERSDGLRRRRRDNGAFLYGTTKDVTALVIALRYMIHHGYGVKEAKELLAQLENDKITETFNKTGARQQRVMNYGGEILIRR